VARRTYRTVPTELIETADRLGDFLEARGYRVTVEECPLGCPYTPTLRATRTPTTLLLEVAHRINVERAAKWKSFGRSCSDDTRFALAVPVGTRRTAKTLERLQSLKVGLYVISEADVQESLEPQDLGAEFELPSVARTPERYRKAIGPSREKFERGDWREGFLAACSALETEAKAYLKREVASTRAVVLTPTGKPRKLTPAQIDRLTIGGLETVFVQIQNQNQTDTVVHAALARIRPDRNAATHTPTNRRTEQRLRKNVAHHMWVIDAALRAIFGVRA
jgi:hypothetical protein